MPEPHRTAALLAAEAASQATTELLRFHRAGTAFAELVFDDPEPTERLAVALLLTARIEQDCHVTQKGAHPEDAARDQLYRENLGQLAAACAKFLIDEHGKDLATLPMILAAKEQDA